MKKINSIDKIEITENNLIVMFGVPASGKSYIAEKLAFDRGAFVMSSDAIREELYGTAECQDDPNRVFSILQQRTTDLLKKGESVIIDATSLIKKYRVSNLKTYKGKFKKAILIVCATELDIIKRQNQERDRHVPEDVIMRMFKTMSFPRDEEGWDEIYVLPHPENKKLLEDYLNECEGIDHDNPHHALDILRHMIACSNMLSVKFPDDKFLTAVGRYHDIGKPIVKSRLKRRGKEWVEDTCSHYVGHADVGAYMAACSPDPLANVDMINLINLHMDKYADKDNHLKNIEENYSEEFFIRYYRLINADDVCDSMSCDPLNELINLVKSIDFDNIKEADELDEDAEFETYVDIPGNVHAKLEDLCCEQLIDKNGNPFYEAISKFENALSEYGIEVIPGEEDDFGWVTGCIVMNDRTTFIHCFG